ncbi:MAG: sigma-70 family RNA polymerase sigma factor [Saprospiraceae bacterium]|nr:sigma-70 family RNA polymerase sigma factor [Saprospiraceae bacterium]HMW40088.1 sigma-70 family RNA polymerase sigma factor [Saprospiraceae bacterium]HMX88251.1 sigma-70 family RNA polymerase sigma factor [Saprospiraceae bacterium]HMZ40712.1 sigma-70 family RNA polymerase sigma factor [Saprospiraceae bacterium]HNA64859.1 sigma-70 family RNA polymerase sigma factor [Saprospiraceae bacterium]
MDFLLDKSLFYTQRKQESVTGDDLSFIVDLQSGNELAYAKLLDEYQQIIFSTCYKFLLDSSMAEDIAQEVFIEIFHSIKKFRAECRLSTWIYRITVSRCLDELRRRKRRQKFFKFISEAGWNLLSDECDSALRPDQQIENEEGIQRILYAMSRLPDHQRIAYTLSHIQGYTHLEISEILGISTQASESLVKRARAKLQVYLR